MNHGSSPLPPNRFSPGGLLDGGKYRLIRELGAGGMGAVFEAENTLTRKRVAIKCLHATRSAQRESGARLLREAEAASRIRHPNVVDMYDVGHDGDSVFLVMEYLEGEPLSKLLARGGIPVHALIRMLIPAMRAVAEAHRCGVVHRDIKPDNIFLAREPDTEKPVPKVLDFGISKLSVRESDDVSLTLSGSTIGTPRYMAYEQLMSDKTIDGRVDVYAFGVILYEALTGHSPFEAESYPELILKVAQGQFASPKERRPELPSTLDKLICWALARDRAARIPSIEQFIRELEPFATERGLLSEMTVAERYETPTAATAFSSTVRSKPATEAEPPAQAPAKKSRRAGLALSAAVAACAGLAITWLQRTTSESSVAAHAETVSERAIADSVHAPDSGVFTAASTSNERDTNRASPVDDAASLEPAHTRAGSTSVAATALVSALSAGRPAPVPATVTSDRPAVRRSKRRLDKLPEPATEAIVKAAVTPAQEPPPPAASPQLRAPDLPAASTPTFRVKLPQSKDF